MGMPQNPQSASVANNPMASTTNQMQQQPGSMKGLGGGGSAVGGGLKGAPQQMGNQASAQGFNGLNQGFQGWRNILAQGQPGQQTPQGSVSSYQFNPAQMPQTPQPGAK